MGCFSHSGILCLATIIQRGKGRDLSLSKNLREVKWAFKIYFLKRMRETHISTSMSSKRTSFRSRRSRGSISVVKSGKRIKRLKMRGSSEANRLGWKGRGSNLRYCRPSWHWLLLLIAITAINQLKESKGWREWRKCSSLLWWYSTLLPSTNPSLAYRLSKFKQLPIFTKKSTARQVSLAIVILIGIRSTGELASTLEEGENLQGILFSMELMR